MFKLFEDKKKVWFVSGDCQKLIFTDKIEEATDFNVQDAYGTMAAASDMHHLFLIPYATFEATEEQCKELGRVLANDVFQNPSPMNVETHEKYLVQRYVKE